MDQCLIGHYMTDMSLPAGFLDELRNRSSLGRIAGRKVSWDTRKSNHGKGDLWAPCPFHQEKTASFHVDDRKGFYYCFGCHAKGDVFSFVRESENVGFMEAVEIVARDAGMEMPARDPGQKQQSDRRAKLAEVMEQALRFYRMQLSTAAAAEARAYLTRRGLDAAALERWEIGFAPAGWQALRDHLAGSGIPDETLLEAGLTRPGRQDSRSYDTFRNRILFPIRDAGGRAIAFGGRAMDPQDKAKYLNSPETPLFDKGRSLYNHGPARTAAGQGAPLIVAEGYMDVIALSGAGFPAVVAPLGTAITESQLQLLWRMAPEPVIALDGDTAGLRAAMRLVDLALPLLEAGQSLRFALLPEGLDPDDLLRAQGPGAMQAALDGAVPMVRLLWQRETEGRVFDSPERRAALDKALRARIATIRDASIRAHYGAEIRNLRHELFAPPRSPRSRSRWPRTPTAASATPGLKASPLVRAGEQDHEHMREAVILASAIVTPQVVPEFESGFEAMACRDPFHAALREIILGHHDGDDGDALRKKITERLGASALENLMSLRHVAISPCLRAPGDPELARMILREELGKILARRGLDAEIAEAEEEMGGLADEALTWRLREAAEARNRALHSPHEDRIEYDTGENGALISREERGALEALLKEISFSKPPR